MENPITARLQNEAFRRTMTIHRSNRDGRWMLRVHILLRGVDEGMWSRWMSSEEEVLEWLAEFDRSSGLIANGEVS